MKVLSLFIILFSVSTFGQNSQINLKDPYIQNLHREVVPMEDTINLYVNDGKSKELFYYALRPKESIEAIVVLLPATGEQTENALNNNLKLSELAFENNLLLVVPSINYNLYLDEFSLHFLNNVFRHVRNTFEVADLNDSSREGMYIILGGFSLGGMNAIRYTELAEEHPEQTFVHPTAVFGVDPPLDLIRLYHSFSQTIALDYSEAAVGEARYYIERLKAEFGGTPKEVPEVYRKHSMYSRHAPEGGNAKYLAGVPVRLYADVDIEWHLKERQNDLYDLNAIDQTAMIRQLKLLGNKNAMFINALGRGYRLNGNRHPHSWSIAAPEALMDWILQQINEN